jgi:hypothetical protein
MLLTQSVAMRPLISATSLITLGSCLMASGWIFARLVRQWTRERPRTALLEWARPRRFRVRDASTHDLPEALLQINSTLEPRISLKNKHAVLIAFETPNAMPGRPPHVWHVLVRRSALPHGRCGLRPAQHDRSLLDLFTLHTYPSLLPPERFVVVAHDADSGKSLAASPAGALLPADVGLLFWDDQLVLDFTHRPFDPIEFSRMLTVSDQVLQQLSRAR